jgi:hypothetical protein
MVLFETLALFGGLKDIFVYNRDLFMFNRQVNQLRIHQIQKMRIEQILLFREDVRDLFDLTMGKMRQYLVVNTLTLAFCMGFFYEGRMPFDTPSWLFWLWGMSLATAVLFLMMSVWFSIYALITAQTFAVRLLTQWLRLPVPSREDISKAAATAADYERLKASSLFRIPIVSSSEQAASSSDGNISPVGARIRGSNSVGGRASTSRTSEEEESYPKMINPALERMFAKDYRSFVEHFHLFRYLQDHFAGYDAYSRVCMVVGSAQLVSVIGYMGVAWYVTDHGRWGGAIFTILMIVFGIVHARMNLLLSRKELIALTIFQIAGPLTGCVAALVQFADVDQLYTKVTAWLVPVAFLFHLLSVTFYLALGSEKNGSLPTKYSTVVSIDVLGLWEEDKLTEGLDDVHADGGGLAWDAPLTGWQRKWLKATKREAPVSALIPQSVDMTNAERARFLRNRGSRGNGDAKNNVFNRQEAASAAGISSSSTSGLMPTRYTTTLPWFTFRQAGAMTILLWLISIGIGISIAVRGSDIPGWETNPASNPVVSGGMAVWQPMVSMNNEGRGWNPNARNEKNNSPPLPRGVVAFLSDVNDQNLPQTIRTLRAVSKEGLHITLRTNGETVRYLIDARMNLVAYSEIESMADFASLDSQAPIGRRAPWCGSWDVVTMVDPGVFRDCNGLDVVWTIDDRRPSHQFIGVSGRYALNQVDSHIYKLQFHSKSASLRTEARIAVPVALASSRTVDLARNEFVLACMSSDGLVAIWSTQHDSVTRKGVRELPNRASFVWKSIVGAGGNSFVVLGENKEDALHEAFYIHNIFNLQTSGRFHRA